MITKDILIYESGNGGELAVVNDDIALVEQLYNQVYLALFGGNVEASTLGNEPAGEIRDDYWANALLWANDPGSQFNSQTELALQNNAMNSIGRVNIERAVKADMQYLNTIANVTVNVVILSTNRVQIALTLAQISNQQNINFVFIWDNARNELITEKIIQ